VYIQRGREPINQLVVDADSQPQTVAKVYDNRIFGRYAWPYGKFDDSIGAVIVSQLIESRSRNEKAGAVGNVFWIGGRIKGQIDEANRTVWKGDNLEIAFFWFASSKDIPLQGEDDPLLR
jgi:hypothetical protein